MNYANKDKQKFSICTHLQSYGVHGSSSHQYQQYGIEGLLLDRRLQTITIKSIVGLSTNGARRNRISFPTDVLDKLAEIGCILVTDNNFHRNRRYNIGEREIAAYLNTKGYRYTDYKLFGIWEKLVD